MAGSEAQSLGHNGTFNAFRVLKQDVAGFENYLDRAASYLLKHPQVDEVLPPGAEEKIGQACRSKRRHVMRPCARSSPPTCAAGGAMARRWHCLRRHLIPKPI